MATLYQLLSLQGVPFTSGWKCLEKNTLLKATFHSGSRRALGDITQALQSYQRVLDIRLKPLGEEHSSTAECFLLLGDAQYAQDDLKSALQSAKETNCTNQNQTFRRRIYRNSWQLLCVSQYRERAKFTTRLRISSSVIPTCTWHKTQAVWRRAFKHSWQLRVLTGNAQLAKDDFTSALHSFQHALHIRIKLFGEEHTGKADSYVSLGSTQFTQDDFTSRLLTLTRMHLTSDANCLERNIKVQLTVTIRLQRFKTRTTPQHCWPLKVT